MFSAQWALSLVLCVFLFHTEGLYLNSFHNNGSLVGWWGAGTVGRCLHFTLLCHLRKPRPNPAHGVLRQRAKPAAASLVDYRAMNLSKKPCSCFVQVAFLLTSGKNLFTLSPLHFVEWFLYNICRVCRSSQLANGPWMESKVIVPSLLILLEGAQRR